MGAFDYPAPGPLPRSFCLFLLAPGAEVGRVAVGRHDAADLVVVVTRIQAQVLLHIGRVPRLTRRDHGWWLASQRTIRPFQVVPIGPVQFDADGQALRLDQEAALDPALAPVRGVGPGFFPPSEDLCSEPSREPRSRSRPITSSYPARTSSYKRAQMPACTQS